MVLIKCTKCDYEWNYSGISKWYASCPMCRRVSKLQELESNTLQGEGSTKK